MTDPTEVWILFETSHDFYGSETSRRVVLVCASEEDARGHLATMPPRGMSGSRLEIGRHPISSPPFALSDVVAPPGTIAVDAGLRYLAWCEP